MPITRLFKSLAAKRCGYCLATDSHQLPGTLLNAWIITVIKDGPPVSRQSSLNFSSVKSVGSSHKKFPKAQVTNVRHYRSNKGFFCFNFVVFNLLGWKWASDGQLGHFQHKLRQVLPILKDGVVLLHSERRHHTSQGFLGDLTPLGDPTRPPYWPLRKHSPFSFEGTTFKSKDGAYLRNSSLPTLKELRMILLSSFCQQVFPYVLKERNKRSVSCGFFCGNFAAKSSPCRQFLTCS